MIEILPKLISDFINKYDYIFNRQKTIGNTDLNWLSDNYNDRAGEYPGYDMLLMMSKSGKFYAGFDDWFIYLTDKEDVFLEYLKNHR